MKSGDRGKAGKYVDTVLRTDFKHLQGDLERKCTDDALVKAVQTMMRWEKPPAKGWLFEVVREYRERANAPEKKQPKRRGPPKRRGRSPSPPPAKRVTKSKAKPPPLAGQDPNQGGSGVATADASSELAQFRALVTRADMALKGETESRVGCDPRPEPCKMRRVGDVE